MFLPMTMLDGVPEEWGNFCSGPCANTYLHTNMRDAFLSARSADLLETLRVVHGFQGRTIGFAPHFTERKAYGGDLSDEAFETIVQRPGLSTRLLHKPFCPTLEVVEWTYVAEPGEDGETASAVLAEVMGSAAPALDHHQQWNVHNLQQPSVEATVRRLTSLDVPEPPEPSQVPFAAFVEAKKAAEAAAAAAGGGAPFQGEVRALPITAQKRSRKRPAAASAAGAAPAALAAPAAPARATAQDGYGDHHAAPAPAAAPPAPMGGLQALVAQATAAAQQPPKKRVRKSRSKAALAAEAAAKEAAREAAAADAAEQ